RSCFDVLRHPARERFGELDDELPRLVDEVPVRIDAFAKRPEVRFRLLHRRHVEVGQRLAQVVIGAEAADGADRAADDSRPFAFPGALAVRARRDVDGVLEHARHRAVVLRRDEQHRVGRLDLALERDPRRRRFAFDVLIEKRQLGDLDDLPLERGRGDRDERVSDLAIEGFLAETSDDDRDGVWHGHSFLTASDTNMIGPAWQSKLWLWLLSELPVTRTTRCHFNTVQATWSYAGYWSCRAHSSIHSSVDSVRPVAAISASSSKERSRGAPGANRMSMEASASPSLWKPWMPPSGT